MKIFIKPLLVFMAILLIIFSTACGGEKDDQGPVTLTLASFTATDQQKKVLQNQVSRFNADHPDVQIELQDCYGEDYQTAAQNRERLVAEIIAGKGPDIIDLGSGGLPLQQLARKGYLEDLWPYIEKDPALGRESLLEAPLRAAEINGGLYTAFDSVSIYTLVGSRNVVGDRTGWTLEDVREAFAAMPEDATVMDFFMTRSDLLYYMLAMCLDEYVDWETGQCSFDCPDFQAAMEFISSFPDQSGIDWSDAATVKRVNEEHIQRQEQGLQMLSQVFLSGPADVQKYDFSWNGASFVGFPVGDGGTGSAFQPPEITLAMSASCKSKDAAWEFIRQSFLPEYDSEETAAANFFDSNIPVNLTDYNLKKKVSMLESTYENRFMNTGNASMEMHPVTEEEMGRFEELLGRISRTTMYDRELFNVVKEVSAPYFAGDKNLDETVDMLQNRVELYVNESR